MAKFRFRDSLGFEYRINIDIFLGWKAYLSVKEQMKNITAANAVILTRSMSWLIQFNTGIDLKNPFERFLYCYNNININIDEKWFYIRS